MSLLEKLIARLKRDPDYRLKTDYSRRQLFWILYYRGGQAVRGLFLRFRLKQCRGLVFCGRRVVIEHGYQLSSGGNLILEDLVHINALSEHGIVLGRNVTIAKGAILVCTGVVARRGWGLTIGHDSAVGAQSFLAAQGGITIGNQVIMGPGVRIFSENHNFEQVDQPIRKQGETRLPVIIEDDCWIGAGVTLLGGVTIGKGTVVAAGAVVTKNLPPLSVAAGVPAKVIRSRTGLPATQGP